MIKHAYRAYCTQTLPSGPAGANNFWNLECSKCRARWLFLFPRLLKNKTWEQPRFPVHTFKHALIQLIICRQRNQSQSPTILGKRRSKMPSLELPRWVCLVECTRSAIMILILVYGSALSAWRHSKAQNQLSSSSTLKSTLVLRRPQARPLRSASQGLTSPSKSIATNENMFSTIVSRKPRTRSRSI